MEWNGKVLTIFWFSIPHGFQLSCGQDLTWKSSMLPLERDDLNHSQVDQEKRESCKDLLRTFQVHQTFKTGHPSVLTPWKINMEPKDGGLEDDFRLGDF